MTDTITSLAFVPLLVVAREHGDDLLTTVRAAAHPLPDKPSLDIHCPISAYFSAWEALDRADSAVVRAVEATSLADLEIFGFLAMTASTLGQAFTRIAAVRAIWAQGAGWTPTSAEGAVRLTYHRWPVARRGNSMATEYAVIDMVRSIREIVAEEVVPVRVGLREAVAHPEQVERVLGVRPEVAKSDFIELPPSIGDRPVAKFDTRLHSFFERECDALVSRMAGDDWLTLVRRQLAEAHAHEVPTATSLARSLGLSPRSLRRRFAEHGTTFTAIRQDVATKLAHAYLRRGLSASETAFALGYGEPSAFFRAYKGWTGQTPGDFATKNSPSKEEE